MVRAAARQSASFRPALAISTSAIQLPPSSSVHRRGLSSANIAIARCKVPAVCARLARREPPHREALPLSSRNAAPAAAPDRARPPWKALRMSFTTLDVKRHASLGDRLIAAALIRSEHQYMGRSNRRPQQPLAHRRLSTQSSVHGKSRLNADLCPETRGSTSSRLRTRHRVQLQLIRAAPQNRSESRCSSASSFCVDCT